MKNVDDTTPKSVLRRIAFEAEEKKNPERRDLSPKGQAVRRIIGELLRLATSERPDFIGGRVAEIAGLISIAYEEGRVAGVSEALTATNEAWHKIDAILTGREEALRSVTED